jgi:hypothetical protein
MREGASDGPEGEKHLTGREHRGRWERSQRSSTLRLTPQEPGTVTGAPDLGALGKLLPLIPAPLERLCAQIAEVPEAISQGRTPEEATAHRDGGEVVRPAPPRDRGGG